jgi:hypothetical protein
VWPGALAALVSEVAALVVLARWGATVPGPLVARVLLGLGLPLAAALLWAAFAAPRAPVRSTPLLVATKVGVLGAAVAATAQLAGPVAAAALAAVSLAGAVLSDAAALRAAVPADRAGLRAARRTLHRSSHRRPGPRGRPAALLPAEPPPTPEDRTR